MSLGRMVRRLAAGCGVVGIALVGLPTSAGAQGPAIGSPLNPDPTHVVRGALELAHHYGDYSFDGPVAETIAAAGVDVRAGRQIAPETDRRTNELANALYSRYAERAAIDAAGGPERYNLAKVAAGLVAPAGCSNDYPFLWGYSQHGQGLVKREQNGKVRVTFQLDAPLCQAVRFNLMSFEKIGGRPWPAPQQLHDYDTVLLKDAGTYTMEVDIPGLIKGLLCATQIDLAREASFGKDGAILPALVDYAQYDIGTPDDAAHRSQELFGADACEAPPVAVGPNTTAAGVQISGSAGFYDPGVQGTLPYTGSNTVPLVLVAVGLIVLGWVFLAGKSAMAALEEPKK